MIAITSESGRVLRTFPNAREYEIGYHAQFGFLSSEAAEVRKKLRKNQSLRTKDNWICSFHLAGGASGWQVGSSNDCQLKPLSPRDWLLETPVGNFNLTTAVPQVGAEQEYLQSTTPPFPWRRVSIASLLLLLVMALIPRPEEEEPPPVEPITVRIENPKRAVSIHQYEAKTAEPSNSPEEIKAAQQRRAVARNLGFLKVMEQKDLTKELGETPDRLVSNEAATVNDASSDFAVGIAKNLRRSAVDGAQASGLKNLGKIETTGGETGYGTGTRGPSLSGLSAMPLSDEIVLEGGLDRSVIQATIAKYLNQVRACYENGLQKNPGIQGLVTTEFEIGASGKLNFAKVSKSSLGDNGVESCIADRMMGWTFPKPRGGLSVKVKYPFLLRPVKT